MREMALMQVNYVSAALLRRRGLSGNRGSDGANRDGVLPLILSSCCASIFRPGRSNDRTECSWMSFNAVLSLVFLLIVIFLLLIL